MVTGVFTATGRLGERETSRETTAIEILKERFARGEIDEAEFKEKRRIIGEA